MMTLPGEPMKQIIIWQQRCPATTPGLPLTRISSPVSFTGRACLVTTCVFCDSTGHCSSECPDIPSSPPRTPGKGREGTKTLLGAPPPKHRRNWHPLVCADFNTKGANLGSVPILHPLSGSQGVPPLSCHNFNIRNAHNIQLAKLT